MAKLNEKNIIKKILTQIPIILLFISVLNNFDFNYLNLNIFHSIFHIF